MIDDETKNKLIKELEKSGNVYLSCLRVGIDHSTYYRWIRNDKNFRNRANQAIRLGRENNCDIAIHALMLKVKDGDLGSIKYYLGHNSPIYKQKQISNVVILHRKEDPNAGVPIKTIEDLFDDNNRNVHEYCLKLHEEFTRFGDEIPNKPDGTPIGIDELSSYETYIHDWQRYKRDEKEKKKFKEQQLHKESQGK